jgi:hypothetical protein
VRTALRRLHQVIFRRNGNKSVASNGSPGQFPKGATYLEKHPSCQKLRVGIAPPPPSKVPQLQGDSWVIRPRKPLSKGKATIRRLKSFAFPVDLGTVIRVGAEVVGFSNPQLGCKAKLGAEDPGPERV